jgi:hypothetical protein
MTITHYALSCSISATVRQSVQIKFQDLKLPQSVIDTLENSNAVSLRPNLSNALKDELDKLRVLQRELYDNYCIHFGDNHFVTSTYFYEAKQLIQEIRRDAASSNAMLAGMWSEEFSKWKDTAEGILRPLFTDDTEYNMAVEAYLKLFPTKEEYKNPISVYVLGPLPVSLTKVEAPVEGSNVDAVLAYENYINTAQVLDAAKNQAADKALMLGAELIDDLDFRSPQNICKKQTGSDKKRGSWEITATKLNLIADSVPGFEHLADIAEDLLRTGRDMLDKSKTVRDKATQRFPEIQNKVREELQTICSARDSSKGLEKLKQSLAMSNDYKNLCEKIKTAESVNVLNFLSKDVNIELDIYEQRGRHLRKLFDQRMELIKCASSDQLDDLIDNIKDADF